MYSLLAMTLIILLATLVNLRISKNYRVYETKPPRCVIRFAVTEKEASRWIGGAAFLKCRCQGGFQAVEIRMGLGCNGDTVANSRILNRGLEFALQYGCSNLILKGNFFPFYLLLTGDIDMAIHKRGGYKLHGDSINARLDKQTLTLLKKFQTFYPNIGRDSIITL